MLRQLRLSRGRWGRRGAGVFLASLGGGSAHLAVAGSAAFDELPYRWDGFGDAPMNTIAGLTEWARDINHVYAITAIITGLVFVAVVVPLGYTMWRFRVPAGTDLEQLPPPKQIHGSVLLELTWMTVPAILLFFIAIPTWQVIFRQPSEQPADALEIEVIGHQWWWEFRYPRYDVTTANELHLPAGRPVFFKIWSEDVIHSFWVPKFGGKKDALPGVVNTLFYVTPEQGDVGVKLQQYFQGQCAELCGDSHALMRFEAVLQSPERFESWLQEMRTPPRVATSLQKRGEELFAQCSACHTLASTPSEEQERALRQAGMGKQGPNLSNLGDRRTLGAGTRITSKDNFIAWVREPQSIKPGALMTSYSHLTGADLDALAAYLLQSTVKEARD